MMFYFALPYVYALLIAVIYLCVYLVDIYSYVYDRIAAEYDTYESVYDYVLVGAGSAGSVTARRLAEKSNISLLLIEAGSNSTWPLDIPIWSPLLQLTSHDWQFQTISQEHSSYGLNGNSSRWPRGKVLGGTSRLNYMLHLRGHWQDYDLWAKDSNGEWSFSEIHSYFKKSEQHKGEDSLHSRNGKILVGGLNFASPLATAFTAAGKELGYRIVDLNTNHDTGFMEVQLNQFNGKRWSADQGFLKEYQGNNIRIMTNAFVDKVGIIETACTPGSPHLGSQFTDVEVISMHPPTSLDYNTMEPCWKILLIVRRVLFHSKYEAYAVTGLRFNKPFKVVARRAIVLAAGTIGTPLILMRSGVGPQQHLKSLKIPVLRNLPVGKNLQDHIATGIDLVLLNQSLNLDFGDIASVNAFLDYAIHGKGTWTTPGCEAIAVVHSPLSQAEKQPPDIQIMALPMGISSDYGSHMKRAVGITEQVWNEYFAPLQGRQVASLLPVLLHPKSHGEIHLKSKDVYDSPLINPKYLSEKEDIEVLLEGIDLVKKIIRTNAMQRLGASLYKKKFPGCSHLVFDTAEYWRCYVRQLTLTVYHPVGTCRMGHSPDTSVVDPHLRVHGTNKLFVVDASIMPTLPSGNINAAVTMIAEKGADLVKHFWHGMYAKSKGNVPAKGAFVLTITLFLQAAKLSHIEYTIGPYKKIRFTDSFQLS